MLLCFAFGLFALIMPDLLSGFFFGILYLVFMSIGLGRRFLPQARSEFSIIGGFLILMSYIVILASTLFYFAEITTFHLSIIILASPILLSGSKPFVIPKFSLKFPQAPLAIQFLRLSYTIIILSQFYILFQNSTIESITSPWSITPTIFFFLFIISIIVAFTLAVKDPLFSWVYYIPIFLISFGISTIIFPLGFGFDPFIHKATESLLASTGTISPKPLYYIGFYVLVEFSSLLLNIPLHIIDTFITPVLASLLIPVIIYSSYRYCWREKKIAKLIPLAFLVFPYSFLIQSTPQAFSFLITIIILFVALIYMYSLMVPWRLLFLLSLMTFLFHPLTGIPIILFVLGIGVYKQKNWSTQIRKTFLSVISIIYVLSIPVALFIAGTRSAELHTSLGFKGLPALSQFVSTTYKFINIDDFIYTINSLMSILLISLAIIGIIYLLKQKQSDVIKPFLGFYVLTLLMLALFNSFISFNFASNLEQTIFASRISTLAQLFLYPIAFIGFAVVFRRVLLVSTHNILLIITLSIIAATSLYLSYPRFDSHYQHKGYTASQHDYEAVEWINKNAEGDYIVMANQTVSAVAIRQYGFMKYYNGLLYYPVPTSGSLYPLFLALTKTDIPIDQTIDEISDLTGVKSIYFVLNQYWDQYEKLDMIHSENSKSIKRLGGGAVTIYQYQAP